MVQLIWDRVQDEMRWRALCQFVDEHDVDTDCIEDDVELFGEEQTSNLHGALQGDDEVMDAVRSFVRHHRIMSKSFATGFPLFYWKWHRTATEKQIKKSRLISSYMDLGGHSVRDLSVYPVFKDIKEEVMATGLMGPRKFHKFVVEKAANILKTGHCRKIRSCPFGGDYGEDPLHFGIKYGSPLLPHHIQSMVIYCDFSELKGVQRYLSIFC